MPEPDPYTIAKTAKGYRARTGLIDAGMRVLGRNGSNRLNVEAVCSEAGIGRTSFYNYFLNIEALFEAISTQFFKDFEALFEGFHQGLPRGATRLEKCLTGTLDKAVGDPGWGNIAARLDRTNGTMRALFQSSIAKEIKAARSAGDFTLRASEVPAYIDLITTTVFATTQALAQGSADKNNNTQLVKLLLRAAGWSENR